MGYWLECWSRPGHANFGRVIDDPPVRQGTWHDAMNRVGDGSMQMPSSFPRFNEILLIDKSDLSQSVSSLVRVWSDVSGEIVGEWLVEGLEPTAAKNDPFTDVFGEGIKKLLSYARTEPFDWDGSATWVPTFPDWIWGGRNILTNPDFEDQTPVPIVYILAIDATAGTFTITDGTDTTSALAFNASRSTIEIAIESEIAAIDDINVSPLGGVPTGYDLTISATGGTFTISSPSDTTGALAFNIGAAALESAIEGLTGVTDVTVTAVTGGFEIALVNPVSVNLSIDNSNLTGGSASLQVSNTGNGYQLELVRPPTGITLAVNPGGLTGSASMTLSQAGELLPSGWTRSQQVSVGAAREFGVYDAFESTQAQAQSGAWSVFIDPGQVNSRIDAFAGIQQVVNVQPNGLYQASIWVRPTAPGQTYRLVIRELNETLVEGARVDVSPPANVWTQVVINDITMTDQSQVIFRFANTQLSGNPAGFYVDTAALREGQQATTVGEIIRDLYEDATVNHAGRVVWDDDANPGTPYLTLDFTDTLDSNGNAWDNPELEVKVWQRMDYLQVMQSFADDWGYEWRVVPDDPEAGTWLWQVYNPGTMDDSPDVAILGGSSDTHRQLRRFLPATDHMVEGEARISARAGNATLRTALGRIETSRLGRNLPSIPAVGQAASEDSTDAVAAGSPWSYELVDPQDEPGAAYRLGDTIAVHDPPEADGDARLWDWVLTLAPERTTHEVMLEEI